MSLQNSIFRKIKIQKILKWLPDYEHYLILTIVELDINSSDQRSTVRANVEISAV